MEMAEQRNMSDIDYAAAARKCDIVMKGGITSGIVYPRAVTRLARDYRFQSIGGTSAGAIAAAVTAAAEYSRSRGTIVFDKLNDIPQWLGESSLGGNSNLLNLFRPQPRQKGFSNRPGVAREAMVAASAQANSDDLA